MRSAVFAKGEAGVAGADLYIFTAVSNALADLVVNAGGGEVGKRGGVGNFSADGQARGHAHHIGFGNAALDVALRKFFHKRPELQRAGEVGGEGDYIGVAAACFEDAFAKAGAGFFFVEQGDVGNCGMMGAKVIEAWLALLPGWLYCCADE